MAAGKGERVYRAPLRAHSVTTNDQDLEAGADWGLERAGRLVLNGEKARPGAVTRSLTGSTSEPMPAINHSLWTPGAGSVCHNWCGKPHRDTHLMLKGTTNGTMYCLLVFGGPDLGIFGGRSGAGSISVGRDKVSVSSFQTQG